MAVCVTTERQVRDAVRVEPDTEERRRERAARAARAARLRDIDRPAVVGTERDRREDEARAARLHTNVRPSRSIAGRPPSADDERPTRNNTTRIEATPSAKPTQSGRQRMAVISMQRGKTQVEFALRPHGVSGIC